MRPARFDRSRGYVGVGVEVEVEAAAHSGRRHPGLYAGLTIRTIVSAVHTAVSEVIRRMIVHVNVAADAGADYCMTNLTTITIDYYDDQQTKNPLCNVTNYHAHCTQTFKTAK